MNERIKELMQEAGTDTSGKWMGVEHASKFAELIIRECCIALNPMLRDMISRGQGVGMIKLHFGMNPKEITTAMLDAAITQCEQELARKKSGVEEWLKD
jgi:hypothetical protein